MQPKLLRRPHGFRGCICCLWEPVVSELLKAVSVNQTKWIWMWILSSRETCGFSSSIQLGKSNLQICQLVAEGEWFYQKVWDRWCEETCKRLGQEKKAVSPASGYQWHGGPASALSESVLWVLSRTFPNIFDAKWILVKNIEVCCRNIPMSYYNYLLKAVCCKGGGGGWRRTGHWKCLGDGVWQSREVW